MMKKQKKEEVKREENTDGFEKKNLLTEALDFRKLKKENFLVLLLAGVLLLVIGMPSSGEKNQRKGSQSGITDSENAILNITGKEKEKEDALEEKDSNDSDAAAFFRKGALAESYREELEKALSDILSDMEGAGRVKVMITLNSSAETVVEKDITEETGGVTEVDSEGGSRNTTDISRMGETVFKNGEGGFSVPYVKQVLAPGIEGVLVCAEGGGDRNVNKNITEAIQALFGIEVHKIKVIKMSSGIKGEAD